MIRSRPLFGVGASNFALANVAFSDQSDAVPFAAQPFNVVLEVLVERGVIGAIGYLCFVFSFFAVSIQAVRLSPDRVTKDTAAVFAIGFFAVLVRDGTYSSMISNAGVSAVVVFSDRPQQLSAQSIVILSSGDSQGLRKRTKRTGMRTNDV